MSNNTTHLDQQIAIGYLIGMGIFFPIGIWLQYKTGQFTYLTPITGTEEDYPRVHQCALYSNAGGHVGMLWPFYALKWLLSLLWNCYMWIRKKTKYNNSSSMSSSFVPK